MNKLVLNMRILFSMKASQEVEISMNVLPNANNASKMSGWRKAQSKQHSLVILD